MITVSSSASAAAGIARARGVAKNLLRGSPLAERVLTRWQQKISYSQFGEDLYLRSYYDRLAYERNIIVETGFYVDIGAFRPMINSNSYHFYRCGWRGINIEPTPGFKQRFDPVRPRDINLEIGIAPEAGTAIFYLFDSPSVYNTLDAGAAARAARIVGRPPKQVPVTLSRLDAVLEQHLAGNRLELLLIDAEGYDIEILRSGDFSRFRPRVVLIEVWDAVAATLLESPVVRFLQQHGYTLHSWLNPNLMLVREDSVLHG